MASITFSVVTTVFNEEKSIETLLYSLLRQSIKPGEIIVVDAGSTDDTVQLVRSVEKVSAIPIRVLLRSGANRSVGRNIGIEAARNTYIAVIDAGCEADNRWLEELASGFDVKHQVVAGFYVPVISTPTQRLFAAYVSTLPEDLNEATYLPSSRSLAFTTGCRAVGLPWRARSRWPCRLPSHRSGCDPCSAKSIRDPESVDMACRAHRRRPRCRCGHSAVL